jgi:hypothetical protein
MYTSSELVTQNHLKVGYTGEVLRTSIYKNTDDKGIEWVTASASYRGYTCVFPRRMSEGVIQELGDWLAGKVMPIVLGLADFIAEG